ncbi:hypothetical protein HDU88_007848 [Geranomyces variabilis]|nr:hypothetical protein HDU88_007848 [Geranomyces variabilis]
MSWEEEKEKGKGAVTTLKVELGAPIYSEDTLKERFKEAKRLEEAERLEKAKAQEKKETMSPTPPEKPKSETKLTFEDILGKAMPLPPEKEAEVKKPLKPKPKPKAKGEGPSASKQPLLTPQEVATLYQVDPDLLTKVLFHAGELKTVPVLEITKPSKPLKSSLKQEVKASKPARKKVVIKKTRTKRRKSKRDESPSSSSLSLEEESENNSQGLTSLSDRDTNKAFRDLFEKQTSPRRSARPTASAATTKKSTKVVVETESSESPSDEDDNGESKETPTTTESETETTETTESEELTRTRRRTRKPKVSASFLKELRQAISKYDGTRSLQKLYNFVDKVNVYIRAKPDVTDKEIIDLVELKFEGAAATWWRSARNKVAPGHKQRLKYRTWRDVRRGLQKTFMPQEDALAMRKQLQVLKQTGSVAKYNDQFWQIAEQIVDPNWRS